ncbi:hypothetical protein V6N11_061710 [Hibiscus sabdariffa]|uniref:PRA1 family protein n=1 Tax=Hibiscus sabdariffa TaxID=183260 RepID=A0ABR2NV56_9ROSI
MLISHPVVKALNWAARPALFSLCLPSFVASFASSFASLPKPLVPRRSGVDAGDNGEDVKYQCVYSGSGKTPLLCSAVAFVGLAAVMLVEHVYMLIAVSKSPPPVGLVSWDLDSARFKTLTWQAAFFFVTTWEGLFCAAGVLTLMTVFLAAGLYLTALHAQKLFQQHHHVRQQVLETSILYASPPASPSHQLTTMAREDPVITELPNQPSSFSSLGDFRKQFNGV